MTKKKAMEATTGVMGERTTETGKMVNSTDKESLLKLMAERGQGSGNMVSEQLGLTKICPQIAEIML